MGGGGANIGADGGAKLGAAGGGTNAGGCDEAAAGGGAFFGIGTTTFVPHCGHVPFLPAALSGTWIVTVQYGQLNWIDMWERSGVRGQRSSKTELSRLSTGAKSSVNTIL